MHILICYILTDSFEMGIKGTGIATTFSNLLSLVAHSIYTTYYTDERLRTEAWFLPIGERMQECFNVRGLFEYFKLGLSSIGMLSLEWWSYELMMVFAASLSVGESATQIIIMNACSFFFMFPLGLQISGSVLVGKEIGGQNVYKSKMYQRFVQTIGVGIALLVALTLLILNT